VEKGSSVTAGDAPSLERGVQEADGRELVVGQSILLGR
jgi:hypothetical protein